MAEGATGAERIKELEQQRALLQWMIDNQRRVNNGVKEHLKARQQLLAVEEQIASAEKLVIETKKEIAKLEKEKETANKKRQRAIKKEIRFLKEFNAENERTVDIQKKERDELKKTLSLKKAIGNEVKKQVIALNKELFNVKKLKSFYLEIDKGVRLTTESLGLSAGSSDILRQNLLDASQYAARFGVTVAEMAKVQKDIARVTGRNLLASRKNFEAISGMVKLIPDIGDIIGELNKFGYNMEDSMKLVEEVYNYAGKIGLNAEEFSKNFRKNYQLASRFRFKNGIADLKKITGEAQRLMTNMESIAGFADKVFRPEGAIEAAAQLQVLGGQFGKLGDPFKLMHMARNDMAGFVDEVMNATKFTAFFNKQTGEFDLAASDLDRLRELAKITGEDFKTLADRALLQSQFGMIDQQIRARVSAEDRLMIQNMAKVGKDGRFTMEIKDAYGHVQKVVDVSKLTPEMIKEMRENQKALEARSKDLMTFQENFDAVANMLRLTLLPVMELLGGLARDLSEWLANLSDRMKTVISVGVIALGAFFAYKSMTIAGGIFGAAAGRAMAMTGGMAGGAGMASGSQMLGAGKMQKARLLGTAAVIAAIGAAVMMVGAGVNFATKGFARLAESMASLPVTHLQAFSDIVSTIMWSMTAMIGILALTAAGLMAFGAMATTPVMWAAVGVLLAIGGAALMLGGGIALASYGMSLLVAEMAKLGDFAGIGMEMLLMSAAIATLGLSLAALGYTLMNPFGAVGAVAGMGILWAFSEMGPNLQKAGEGAKLLTTNLYKLGGAVSSLGDDNMGGALGKLERISNLVQNTKTNPIRVLVEGDLGGKLDLDVVGDSGLRKILLNDGRFLRDLTEEIEERLNLDAKISGK